MTQWRLGSIALFCLYGTLSAAPSVGAQPVEPAVQAANRFLATLSEAQRAKVVYAWSDDAQRAVGQISPRDSCRVAGSASRT